MIKQYSELGNAKIFSVTEDHTRYNCPFCEELVSKADLKGKLYYSKTKRVGYCFRCQTVLVNKDFVPELQDVVLQFNHRQEEVKPPPRFTLSNWTHTVDAVPEVSQYLKNRRIGDQEIKHYGLLACQYPFKGVVIPSGKIHKDDTVDFFSIRNVESNYPRYINSPAPKPLGGWSNSIGLNSNICLSEGCFSAASMLKALNYKWESLFLLGKWFSNEHLQDLANCQPAKVLVAMDGGERDAAFYIARKLLSMVISQVRILFLPIGKDPNDFSTTDLQTQIYFYSLSVKRNRLSIINHRMKQKGYNYLRSAVAYLNV